MHLLGPDATLLGRTPNRDRLATDFSGTAATPPAARSPVGAEYSALHRCKISLNTGAEFHLRPSSLSSPRFDRVARNYFRSSCYKLLHWIGDAERLHLNRNVRVPRLPATGLSCLLVPRLHFPTFCYPHAGTDSMRTAIAGTTPRRDLPRSDYNLVPPKTLVVSHGDILL